MPSLLPGAAEAREQRIVQPLMQPEVSPADEPILPWPNIGRGQ